MENNQIQADKKPFLTLQHVEKIYPNGEKAVYDFNLDVYKQEFIVIVGPSGCGKSTTLRMIAGLEDITTGDIYLENELLNYKPSKDRKMAIVFQSYALYPQMNVFDNIAFPLTINSYPEPATDKFLYPLGEVKRTIDQMDFSAMISAMQTAFSDKIKKSDRKENIADIFGISPEAASIMSELYSDIGTEEIKQSAWKEFIETRIEEGKRRLNADGIKYNEKFELIQENGEVKMVSRKLTPYEIRTKVYETAEVLDLKPYLDKLPKELSGGQMQRVALGRAIIKNVPIFMMDEPLSNLDAKLRLVMRSEIVKLHNRIHATTIYVTHDQTEAMTMASRIVVMSRGFIQQIGCPEDVYNHPLNIFVAKFIGSPSMNIFEGNFDKDSGSISFGNMKIKLGSDFNKKHDEFYQNKANELTELLKNFDEVAREKILKLLSTTGEEKNIKRGKTVKKSIWEKIKEKFSKTEPIEKYAFEKGVCEKKLAAVQECLHSGHTLTLGIRPERIRIEKIADKTSKDCFIVKPTVCELLGGEYNVHFDFCNQDMAGRFDAKNKISTEDEIAISFLPEDFYIFDKITGDVIG